MEIYAYYLPQFHQVPENDLWWGTGFTEWTNVKAAKPLFAGHRQPKEPLGDNYYNLLDYDTVKWQTDIAKQYGIDGFVYYHYYFNGKLLLEKPAENFLKWTDIRHSFYFCWANHSWYKSVDGNKELLLEQTYGSEADWRKHFEYLLPFFKDSRYKKIDNKPVFMIFQPRFPHKRHMLRKFERWCKEEGFSGIYYIESALVMLPTKLLLPGAADAYVLREFNHSRFFMDYLSSKKGISYRNIAGSGQKLPVYDGNGIYDIMIKRAKRHKKVVHALCFAWDNTPRHGKSGYVVMPPDKDMVMKYLECVRDDDMLLINAWNEWAEGMVLEPTKEEGFRYLEWIREWKDRCFKSQSER